MDSTRVSRANTELHSMKMKDYQRRSDFYASWSNKLTEARGDFWPDDNKMSLLQSAINKRLAVALAGNRLLPDDDFHGLIKIVNKIAQRLDSVDFRFSIGEAIIWHKKGLTPLLSKRRSFDRIVVHAKNNQKILNIPTGANQ